MKDYYKILGVSPSDEIDIIKQKTKNNIKNVQKNSSKYLEMREAYYVLTSYFKRQQYDRFYNQPYNFINNSFLDNMLNNVEINSNNFFSKSYTSTMKLNKDGNYEKNENWITNNNNKKDKKSKKTIYDKNGNKLLTNN